MIGYCPLEELEPPARQQQPVVSPKAEPTKPLPGLEETECNYVVMAFIVGVLFLAVSDSIRA
jgi:hypothetical protein